METSRKGLIGLVAAILVTCAVELGFMIYRESCIKTDQLNPINQFHECKRWNQLYEKIFGHYGFADTNKDGVLTFEEKAKAYRLMGYNDFFGKEEDFPAVFSINRLERAIDTYKRNK